MQDRRSTITAVLLAVALILTATVATGGCGSDGNNASVASPSSMEPLKPGKTSVIIDTDVGPDDFIAIPFLLNSPVINVMAITIAGTGEAHVGPGTRNIQRMLRTTGDYAIPVGSGRETPLEGSHHFPAEIRQNADSMEGMFTPGEELPYVENQSAVELLKETIGQSPEKVTFCIHDIPSIDGIVMA